MSVDPGTNIRASLDLGIALRDNPWTTRLALLTRAVKCGFFFASPMGLVDIDEVSS